MIVYFVLTIIFVGLFMLLALSMVAVSTIMTIIAIYYSFVKRAGLLFSMFWKLKKSTTQKLGNYEREKRVQNAVLGTKFSAFAFQESLALSRREYRIIFCIAFLFFVLFLGFIIFMAFLPKSVFFLQMNAPVLLRVGEVVFKTYFDGWAYIVFSLPVILILYMILQYGVKKMIRKLEQFASTTAKPISL